MKNNHTEIVLFSGGVDSCVLLKYLLEETDKNILCIYAHTGWCLEKKQSMESEAKAAYRTRDYFKKHYRHFDFVEYKIETGIVDHWKGSEWGYDPHWLIFFAGMHARAFKIKKIWHGTFSYIMRDFAAMGYDVFNGPPSQWYNGDLIEFLEYGTRYDPFTRDIVVTCPYQEFNGKGLDRFLTKKEAFTYLEPELRYLTKSCLADNDFCSKCKKCEHWIKTGIKDKEGKWLV